VSDRYRKDERALAQLTPTQRAITQESATEPAFDNEFWDHKEAGVYEDLEAEGYGEYRKLFDAAATKEGAER
jgi:peptide methionine sulfoxide reductase MsrB